MNHVVRGMLSNISGDSHDETLAQKAQLICDQISEKMGGAQVNWKRKTKTFYFTIHDAGSRFIAQFSVPLLQVKRPEEIEEEIHKLVERILCETSQRPTRRAS